MVICVILEKAKHSTIQFCPDALKSYQNRLSVWTDKWSKDTRAREELSHLVVGVEGDVPFMMNKAEEETCKYMEHGSCSVAFMDTVWCRHFKF